MSNLRASGLLGSMVVAAGLLTGCGSSQDKVNLQPGTATTPDGQYSMPTNLYTQTNPGMGSRVSCLAGGVGKLNQADDYQTLQLVGCQNGTGPERAAVDVATQLVGAASNMAIAAGTIKGAFFSSGSAATSSQVIGTQVFQETITTISGGVKGSRVTVAPGFGD